MTGGVLNVRPVHRRNWKQSHGDIIISMIAGVKIDPPMRLTGDSSIEEDCGYCITLFGLKPDAPLADLDTSKYSYASFIYPMDLGAPGTGKDHYMVFHINETSTTSFTTRGTGAVDQQNPMGKNLAAGEMSTNQKNGLVDQANNEGNSVALNSHTADPQGTSNIGTSGQGAVQTAVAGIKQPVTRIATTIVLYMPPEIKVKYDADWAATDLGLAADLTNALKGSGTWGDFWKSMGASAGQQAGERLNDLTNMKIKESLSRAGRMVIN